MGVELRPSKITNVPPSFAVQRYKDGHVWLKSKRKDDAVEDDLWRINDTLYDFTDFVHKHPGGSDWISVTKGLDITEAVETHHIYPEKLEIYLKKYRVRETTKPRNSKLTFKEDGFYVTMRKKVAAKLPHIVKTTPKLLSKIYVDGLFIITLLTAILSVRYHNYLLALLTSILYTWTGICGHNFLHQKNNFRMMYFNLLFMSYRDWRLSHVLSHHMHTNSLLDVEVMIFEPFFIWTPSDKEKNWVQRYVSWIYTPIFYVGVFLLEFSKKVVSSILVKNTLHLEDLLPTVVPIVLYLFGGDNTFGSILKWYLPILGLSSFWFGLIGINAGHHHPENIHDGDTIREGYDFGLYTLDTVIDREDLRGNTLMAMTNFGDHALHHLFPTIDNGILPHLYDILFETLNEFEAECRTSSWYEIIKGQLQQLARIEPHQQSPPERFKSKKNNNIKNQNTKIE